MTAIANELNALLADYQVLYQKLRNYHWNVTGPMFFGLHARFEELYRDASDKVDELAERVVALGERPASTLKEQLAQARLAEDPTVPAAHDMVRNVHADLESLTSALRTSARRASDEDDVATANLLEGFADGQEKTAWMLRAFLGA